MIFTGSLGGRMGIYNVAVHPASMKPEETTSSPTTPATTPATPATTYPTQWASTLQQQTATSQYYPYPSHYPQTPYATHYQAYAPPVSAAAGSSTPAQAKPYQTTTYNLPTSANSAGAGASNPMDTSDIATLNDALGSAGVDLRAEEESLQQSNASGLSSYPRTYEDRTRKQPLNGPAFDTRFLSATMRTVASNHKVTRIPDDAVNYLALCLRARLQDLITAMVKAAMYRTDGGFDRPAGFYEAVDGGEPTPMWSILVRNDVAKQLAALERVEREEELRIRKERKERAELQAAHAAALAAQASGASNMGDSSGIGEDDPMGGGPKKKRKKEGPGVTARNMSEDVRKKMSNAVATQAAGLGGKYAWMTSANATGAGAAKPKTGGTSTTASVSAMGSSWARPYVPTTKKPGVLGGTAIASGSGIGGGAGAIGSGQVESEESAEALTRVTMRDAMFVIDRERGHGGGRGSARGWT